MPGNETGLCIYFSAMLKAVWFLYSVIPGPSPPPAFDHLQYAYCAMYYISYKQKLCTAQEFLSEKAAPTINGLYVTV